MITQTLKLNLIPGQVLPRVNVSQYDAGTRTLQMLLYNGDQAFNIPTGYGGFVQGTKPDRTGFQYAATVTEGSNVVTLVVTQQMAAVSGEVTCELVIANGNDRIATVNFILYVEPAALADDTVISETELPLIEEAAELAQRIDGIAADVEADADRAEAAADNAETWVSNYPRIGQNGNWFVFDTTTETFVDTGVSATGPQGPQGDDGPTGPQGPTGPTGNGIVSITKTGTSGLVDTYTITFTDGTTTTFTVTNGQDGQGSGDMTKAVYDSTNAVADAGGIVAYVAAHSGAGTLAGLDDVTLSSLAAGDTLVYNPTTQRWENSTVIQTLSNQVNEHTTALASKVNTSDIANNLTTTTSGKVLDARQGKTLNDSIASLTNTVSSKADSSTVTALSTSVSNMHKVTRLSVSTSGWTSDTSSQSGTTLYKKSVALNHAYVESPSVDIGASGVLPTSAQQEAYDLLQYVTCDSAIPRLYLYASAIPTTAFYINVEGVD